MGYRKCGKRLQPEKIWNEPKELSIQANWDRNETITIPKTQVLSEPI